MTLAIKDQIVHLDGRIGAEDAQDLLEWLCAHPEGQVDLSECEHLHAAALQCLLALKPVISALPADPWLKSVLNTAASNADKDPRNKETAT